MKLLDQTVSQSHEQDSLGPLPWGMRITGVGGYVPKRVVSNKLLARFLHRKASELRDHPLINEDVLRQLDTNDEWIFNRTGIKERHYAERGQATSDIAVPAVQEALETAGLRLDCIDFLICGTVTGDFHSSPLTGTEILRKLGHEGVVLNTAGKPRAVKNSIFVYDTSAACTTFGVSLLQSYSLIRAGLYRKGIVVGVDKMEQIGHPFNRETIILFGSGAGAFVVEAVPQANDAFRPEWFDSGADGRFGDKLVLQAGGTVQPITLKLMQEMLDRPWYRPDKLSQEGRFVFNFVVSFLADAFLPQALKRAGLEWGNIDHVFFHMANWRLIEAMIERIKKQLPAGVKFPRVHNTIESFANTTSATVPLGLRTVLARDWEAAITEDVNHETIMNPGDLCLFCTFGGGVTWTSCIARWTGVHSMPLSYLERYGQACLECV